MAGDAHLSGPEEVSNASGDDSSVGCSLIFRGSRMLSGVVRQGQKRAYWNEHQQTCAHTMNHTGQYLFFILISVGLLAWAGSGGTEINNQKTGVL